MDLYPAMPIIDQTQFRVAESCIFILKMKIADHNIAVRPNWIMMKIMFTKCVEFCSLLFYNKNTILDDSQIPLIRSST